MMHIDFSYAPWGMIYTAFIYVVGNAVWMNQLARRSPWYGWLLWIISALAIIVLGAAIEIRLGESGGVWARLTSVDAENHWIVASLYALLSVPAAASVIFRQNVAWTRLAVCGAALLVLLPQGVALGDPESRHLDLSLGITIAVVGTMWFWSLLFDSDPKHRRKTVPVEEMDA